MPDGNVARQVDRGGRIKRLALPAGGWDEIRFESVLESDQDEWDI